MDHEPTISRDQSRAATKGRSSGLGRDVLVASICGGVVALMVGGFALSSVVSILAVVLPAGLGAREAVLLLTLGAVLTGGALVTVVALSRILTTTADLIGAAVAGVATSRAA